MTNNRYAAGYSTNGAWTRFCVVGPSMYDALDWIHANIQRWGVFIEHLQPVEPTLDVTGDWAEEPSWMKRFARRNG